MKITGNREVSVKAQDNIVIMMSSTIYSELFRYIMHYESEVSGCGLVEVQEKQVGGELFREFRITELILPEKQDNSASSTDIDEAMVHSIMHKMIQENKDMNKLRLHWHSHASMSVFHSGTDEDNYKTLNNKDFLVSLVGNRDGDLLGRVDYYNPMHIAVSGVPIYVEMPVDESRNKVIDDNIAKLDKYVEENKKSYVYDCKEYGFTNGGMIHKYTDKHKDSGRTDKRKKRNFSSKGKRRSLRRKYNLTDLEAKRFEDCLGGYCESCPDMESCTAYRYELEIDRYQQGELDFEDY